MTIQLVGLNLHEWPAFRAGLNWAGKIEIAMSQDEKQELNIAKPNQAEQNQAESSLKDTSGVQMPVGFEFIEVIGSGAFGTLVKAFQKVTRRTVTVKILQSTNLTEEARLRFHREAQILASLDHPNIQKVLGFGFITETTPYIVNEYIDGMTLEEKLSKQRVLSLKEFAEVFPGLLEACEFLHERNIIHRDIKPGNIILAAAEEDEPAIPKLIDFGLAKLLDDQRPDQTLTQTGAILGTPAYMSPEQSQGKVANGKSDVFSLACVIYESLDGRAPWLAESPLELIYKRSSEKPEAMDKNRIPVELEKLVTKMLSADPRLRPSSTQAKDDLEDMIRRGQFQQIQDGETRRANFKTMIVLASALVAVAVFALSFALIKNTTKSESKPENKFQMKTRKAKIDSTLSFLLRQSKELGKEAENNDLPKDKRLAILAKADQQAITVIATKGAAKEYVYSAYCQRAHLAGLRHGVTLDSKDRAPIEDYFLAALATVRENGKVPVTAYVAELLLAQFYFPDQLEKAEPWCRELLHMKELIKQGMQASSGTLNIPTGLPGRDYGDEENLLNLRAGQIWCHKGKAEGEKFLKHVIDSPNSHQKHKLTAAFHLRKFYRRTGNTAQNELLKTRIDSFIEGIKKTDESEKNDISSSLLYTANELKDHFDALKEACEAMDRSNQLQSLDGSTNPESWIATTEHLIGLCKRKNLHVEEALLTKQLQSLKSARTKFNSSKN